MKNTLLFVFVLCAMLLGCTQEGFVAIEETKKSAVSADYAEAVLYQNAVYHAASQSWIYPIKDPYSLDNVKQAYENLLTGKSFFSIAEEVVSELEHLSLEATHYYLKIYPRNEEELSELEDKQGTVYVSHIPFDYVQVPQSVSEDWGVPQQEVENPEVRYTVTYTDVRSTQDEDLREVTYDMPIIYAIWPCSVMLPEHMDYEILYEVYWPTRQIEWLVETRSVDTKSADAVDLLEREALRLADVGLNQTRSGNEWTSASPFGTCLHLDNFLGEKVPLVGLKIRFQLGTRVWETYTQNDGSYAINELVPAEASMSMVFESGEGWKITAEGSLSPRVITWGLHADVRGREFCPVSSMPIFETHRAVQFYKSSANSLNRGGAIRIEVSTQKHESYLGVFYSSSSSDPYIVIYNSDRDNHNRLLCTVFHELGHNSMYSYKGYKKMSKTDDLICEGWGSFAGWFVDELYYKSLGYGESVTSRPGGSVGDDRQSWHGLDSRSMYSPLFIDLMDNCNQRSYYMSKWQNYYYHGYPDDNIQNVPVGVIQSIAFVAQDREDFIREVNKYTFKYYTKEMLEAYLYNAYVLYWYNY